MARLNIPELNDSIIGWIYNEAYSNLWRVGKWYDFEDLVQDGLTIALLCRQRYPDVEPAHFTSLVKTSFHNHVVNLTRRIPETPIGDLDVRETKRLDELPTLPEQEFACTLNELPEPIKAVLRLFLSEESLRRLRLPLRETLTDSETPAKRLKRLAGWPEEKDFESELEKLLFPG